MKFNVSTAAISAELSTLSGAISNNSILPILEDFLFSLHHHELRIAASDLETSMSTSLQVEGIKDGKVAIPAKILLDTLKALPDQPLEFDIDDDTYAVTIQSQTGKYKLAGENGNDFPLIPENKERQAIEMPAAILLNAINKTIFAVSSDELRPAMTGVLVSIDQEGTNFVATDAHKLVKYSHKAVNSSQFSNFIVPRKAMNLLKGALAKAEGIVNISYNNTNAFFTIGNTLLVCRLIDARFPDYNAVIPRDNGNMLTLPRGEFQNALRRLSIYSSKTTYQVILDIQPDEVILSAQDADFANEANERMQAQYEGNPMRIAFNARFLLEMLNVLGTDDVLIKLSTPSRAGLIEPVEQQENEEVTMLVMPIMMNY